MKIKILMKILQNKICIFNLNNKQIKIQKKKFRLKRKLNKNKENLLLMKYNIIIKNHSNMMMIKSIKIFKI